MLKIKFRFSDSHKDEFPPAASLDNVFIDLTSRCNLNCSYCFNYETVHDNHTDLPVRIVEKLLEDPLAEGVSSWFLSGGEPLLYPQLDELLALFQKHGVRPKIASNGYMMSPIITDKLISFDVNSVQFSIDTLDENQFRVLRDGSVDVLQRTIDNLKYAVSSPLRTVVSSVLTKINSENICSMMTYFSNLGVDSYTLYLYTPGINLPNMHDFVLTPPEVLVLLDNLIQYYYDHINTRIIDTNLPWIEGTAFFNKWKGKIDLRTHGCGAGQFTLSVNVNGKVSPCICQDSDDFVCGDLNLSDLSSIWHSAEIETFRSSHRRIPECNGCQILSTCRGGCRNNAYVFGNRGVESYDNYCKAFQGIEISTKDKV